ncbi:hypothetical protein G9A89_015377 [Geosiphon pyriformis]|nr:hypothetical protein G9A89_015377 [Geosiphon pyriformis]
MLRKKLMKLQFQKATDKTITTKSLSIIQKTQPKPSDKHIFRLPSSTTALNTKLWNQHQQINQQWQNQKILAELAFNFYVNKKIAYLLGTPINTESVRETFYHKLIQNTSLPTNYNFASIITEINKKIEHHTQQRYPITYASKDKEKLQTPAKHRIKSPTNSSYHYTPENTINITSTGASTSNATSTFEQFLFQSKQRKEDLLGPYSVYFERFKLRSPMPSGVQSPPPQLNFRITDPWESTKLEKKQEEKKEEESEDQEFTYQNLITENLDIKTPNFQTQQD